MKRIFCQVIVQRARGVTGTHLHTVHASCRSRLPATQIQRYFQAVFLEFTSIPECSRNGNQDPISNCPANSMFQDET